MIRPDGGLDGRDLALDGRVVLFEPWPLRLRLARGNSALALEPDPLDLGCRPSFNALDVALRKVAELGRLGGLPFSDRVDVRLVALVCRPR